MVMKNGKVTKFLLAIVVVVSIFAINVRRPLAVEHTFTNYFGVEMTMDEYLTLLNLGFTTDEIYYMVEDEFEENKDLDATLLASNTKYYKTVVPMFGMSYSVEVTPSEYLNQGDAQILDTLSTYWRQEVSTISQNGTKYRYKISTNWLNWPSVFSYDVIAIGFQNSVYISSNNPYFTFAYTDGDGVHSSTVFYDKKKTAYGASAVYKMPSNVLSLTDTLYFDVMKNTNDTLTQLTFCGDYAHALSPVTTTQAANHVVNVGGIDFDDNVLSYYDETPCCYASIYGISW
jgi:hypothetical protein